MSEELKPQEAEDERPLAAELSEYELNEISGGNGGNPILPTAGLLVQAANRLLKNGLQSTVGGSV